jgi:tetratricopeptide (TPR) repeat protein
MKRVLLAAAAAFVLVPSALAQDACPLTLEGRWIDEASSNIKGRPNQVTGFLLRRQGEGYYVTTIYDFGAKAVPRGYFRGGAAEMTYRSVLGQDDLTMMFQGTVVGPVAVAEIAARRPKIERSYKLTDGGNTIEINGETLAAEVNPNGTLHRSEHISLEYKSHRAPWPKPCEAAKRTAGWDAFKAKANAFRDAKDKPALSDEVRQYGMLGVDAVNTKNFDAALNEFESGLALEPLWPNGHYNAAMVYAQTGDYESAVYHMKAYLELTPADDKEFQANRDRILLWQGKLKQQMAEPMQAVAED